MRCCGKNHRKSEERYEMSGRKIRIIALRVYWVIAIYWLTAYLKEERCPILLPYKLFFDKWNRKWMNDLFAIPIVIYTTVPQLIYYPAVMAILCFLFGKNLYQIRKNRQEGKTPSRLYYVDCVLSVIHLIWLFVVRVLCW